MAVELPSYKDAIMNSKHWFYTKDLHIHKSFNGIILELFLMGLYRSLNIQFYYWFDFHKFPYLLLIIDQKFQDNFHPLQKEGHIYEFN